MKKLHTVDDETKVKPATQAGRRAKQKGQRAAKPEPAVEAEKPVVKVENPPVKAPVVQAQEKPQDSSQETEKTREQIQAEREARKLEKQMAKKKVGGPAVAGTQAGAEKKVTVVPVEKVSQIKSVDKKTESKPVVVKTNSDGDLAVKMEKLHIVDDEIKAQPLTKAERRAKQEEQRAAKAKALEAKSAVKKPAKKPSETPAKKLQETKSSLPSATPHKTVSHSAPVKASALHKVKLFKHLYSDKCDLNINVNQKLHPAIIKLGLQYESDSIVGSNARCYAFLNAMKIVSFTFLTET